LFAQLINLFARDHAHCLWHSTVTNAAEEAVEEELLPYKANQKVQPQKENKF